MFSRASLRAFVRRARSLVSPVMALVLFAAAPTSLAAAPRPAQEPTAAAAASGKSRGAGLVVYRDAAGQTVCRSADAEEMSRLLKGVEGRDRHLIYAGAPLTRTAGGDLAASPNAALAGLDPAGQALAPSAGLHIFLHGTAQLEQNQTAKNAFIVAANRWEAVISTPINIVLDVDYGTTRFGTPFSNANIIGATSSAELVSRLSDVKQRLLDNSPTAAEQALYNALPSSVPTELNGSNFGSASVRMTLANARALGLAPDVASPDTADGDAGIGFNSAFGFDFDPSNGIDADKTDFDAVATHEMGHALGLFSESGGPVYAAAAMWDIFRFRPGAASAANFATTPRVMSAGGTQVFFANQTNTFGTQELQLSTGGPTGAVGDRRQSSHWKDDALTGAYIGIMDPTIGDGVRQVMTDNDIKAIDALGYSTGAPVAHPAPPPAPPTGPPANDNFAGAAAMSGASGTLLADNTGATRQTGEPTLSFSPGGRSVWFNWTAPASGDASIDTEGSAFDTMLGVYTGSAVDGLTQVAANDDVVSGQFINSRVTFTATAGTTYRVQVDGFVNDPSVGADFGFIQLNWGSTAAPTTSTIGFSQADYGYDENVGTAQITISRTGDTGAAQSVGFFTGSGGTATLGVDYDPTSGLVTFNPGETSKTVGVVIRDDAAVEPNETVSLGLNNPSTGVALGLAAATLTIQDDDTIGPNSVHFNASGQDFAEGAGKATVTVQRVGDLRHAATVFYRTSDVNASERSDYTAAAGTLRFAAGEGSKTFDVLVTDDRYAEPTESFEITLSSPSQTAVDGPSVFRINILDNDATTGGSPVRWDANFNPAFFIRQHYADFLNREPDAPGLAFWIDQLTNCGNPNLEVCRVNASGAFFQAIEFQETGYLAYRTYKAAFGDATGTARDANNNPVQVSVPVIRFEEFLPDTRRLGENVIVGQGDWQGQLEANKQAYMLEFVQRQRFLDAFPTSLSAVNFVNKLDQNAGGVLTQAERDQIAGSLALAGSDLPGPRAVALRAVAESAALRTRETNRAFVLMQYFGYLRRNPNSTPDSDYTGYQFWLGKLNEFNGNYVNAEMVKAFLISTEYIDRFGTRP